MSSKSKIDKDALKGPDVFVSITDRGFAWVERHLKAIGLAVGALFLSSAGYVAYSYYVAGQETKAAQQLYKYESAIEKVEERLRDKKAAGPAAEDFAKDFGPSVNELKAALKDHSGSRAALVSALNLVAFLLEKKQFQQALEILEIPKYQPSNDTMLNGFYQMHRGVVFLENKNFDEAEKSYQAILNAKSLKYFHPEALLKMGVVYELKGDTAKARQTYEKLEREYPQSEASKTAQQYIRLLEMKPQQG